MFPDVMGLPGESWQGKRIFTDLAETDQVVVMSTSELKFALLEAFLEGQRFARAHSLEGQLEKISNGMADASLAMKRVQGRPTTPKPGVPIFFTDSMRFTALERSNKDLKQAAQRMVRSGQFKRFRG